MSIKDHNIESRSPVSYAKIGTNTQKVIRFIKYLHEFLPCLEQEYNDLEALQAKKPNDKFPIKMDNLAAIYQAEKSLYELYVIKASNYNNQ